MMGRGNTIAAKINDIRREADTADIVGTRGAASRRAGDRRVARLMDHRSPLTSVRSRASGGGQLDAVGSGGGSSRRDFTSVAPTGSGLGSKRGMLQHGMSKRALYQPRRPGKNPQAARGTSPHSSHSSHSGGRGGSSGIRQRAGYRATLDRLTAINETWGSPADDATDAINTVADMLALADDLKRRIATSYNAAHVQKRLRGLLPKVSGRLDKARHELVKRADGQLASVREGLRRLEGYMTVHVENADATEQTHAIQRVHGLVGKAQHAKVKCKAEPESIAISETYIDAVKAAHSALEDAGALLTKLASRAIEQAVETLDKSQQKLYRLKARVMKRTPQDSDDYSRHFPDVAAADSVLRLARAAKENMQENPNSFDFADAFIDAAAACPAAVAAASLSIQKRAIAEAAKSLDSSEEVLDRLRSRMTTLDSARRKQLGWAASADAERLRRSSAVDAAAAATATGAMEGKEAGDGAGEMEASPGGGDTAKGEALERARNKAAGRIANQVDRRRAAQWGRLDKGVDTATAMATSALKDAVAALREARAAHKDLLAAPGMDTKLARKFVKLAGYAGSHVAMASRRCGMREAAVLACTRHALQTSRAKLAMLVQERSAATAVAASVGAAGGAGEGGGAGGDRVSNALSAAEAAVSKAVAASDVIKRATIAASEARSGGGLGDVGSGEAGASVEVKAMFGDAASDGNDGAGAGAGHATTMSEPEKQRANDELLNLVDAAHTSVAIAADAMRAVRLTAAGRTLKAAQSSMAELEGRAAEAGSEAASEVLKLPAVEEARNGIEAALEAKQTMTASPDAIDLVETFIVLANNTSPLMERARNAVELRGREELAAKVESSSTRLTLVRAAMDQLEFMHKSLGDGEGAGVSVPELELATRLMVELDRMQHTLMTAHTRGGGGGDSGGEGGSQDGASDAELERIRAAFVAGVPRVMKAVDDAEMALQSLAKQQAARQLKESRAAVARLAREAERGQAGTPDAAAEALAEARRQLEEAETAQSSLNTNARDKQMAATFIKAAMNTQRVVTRLQAALQSRYHRNLNADAGACVEALSGYRADVVQLVFMHRVMRGDLKSKSQAGAGGASTASSRAGSASTTSTRKRGSHLGAGMDAESTPGADESFPPELEAALAKVEQAEATATKLRSTPDGDEERWALAESLKTQVKDVAAAVARADNVTRGVVRTQAMQKLETYRKLAADLQRQNKAEHGLGSGNATDGAMRALAEGLEEAEEARLKMVAAERNIGKSATTGNGVADTIDRHFASCVDAFAQSVGSLEPLLEAVSNAMSARRKRALDQATADAFSAFRYLRAGVDGLLGRVKAAKLKNMPQDVSTAVTTVERVEALQVELAAAKKGEAKDARARKFIASLPGLQRAAAQATAVLNKRDAAVVTAASTLLKECRHDVDVMKARNAVAGQPYDEASKLVGAAAAALASCNSALEKLTDGSVDEMAEARKMSLTISTRKGNKEMAAAQAALAKAKRDGGEGSSESGSNRSLAVLDPAQDESFKGNVYDTTTAVRFAAQVTACHGACSAAAEAVKKRDVKLFTSRFDELRSLEDSLPLLTSRVTALTTAGHKAGEGEEEAGAGAAEAKVPRALRGCPAGLVEEVQRCREKEREAHAAVTAAVAEASKAVMAVPKELTMLPSERVSDRKSLRRSKNSNSRSSLTHSRSTISIGSGSDSPLAESGSPSRKRGSLKNKGGSGRHMKRVSSGVSGMSSGDTHPMLSASSSVASLLRPKRTTSLSSMAAALSLREYCAEPGDAACSAIAKASTCVATLRRACRDTDLALVKVAHTATKALAMAQQLSELAVKREADSREQAEAIPSSNAAEGKRAVESGDLSVTAAASLKRGIDAELARIESEHATARKSRRGSITAASDLRAARRASVKMGSRRNLSDSSAGIAVASGEVMPVPIEDDLRSLLFPFNEAVQRAVADVTTAVRALDTRDALVVAATKQRLGGEVLAASESLAQIQKGLRDLQERLASVPSSNPSTGGDGTAGEESKKAQSKTAMQAAQAVEKLSKAFEEATALRAKVLTNTKVSAGGKSGRKLSGAGPVTDESVFGDAEKLVAMIKPTQALLAAASKAVAQEEDACGQANMESSNARIAAASEDATFLHGAVQTYRELAKRNRHRDRATQRRAQRKLSGAGDGSGQHLRASDSKTSLHSNKSGVDSADADLQAVVTQVNLACQVVADAMDAQERCKRSIARSGTFASRASIDGEDAGAVETKASAAATEAAAQLQAFSRLAQEAEEAVGKGADMIQDHATSVISDAITVLDDSQEELNTLVEGTRALEETDANSPLTVALRDAQKAVEKADTAHAALLRQDEVGDWKGVVAAAPEFSELAHACVGYLGRVRELLAIRMANVQATMQRADEMLAQLSEAIAELSQRARVLTVGSDLVRCRVDASEGVAQLTAAKDALDEAKERQKDLREAEEHGAKEGGPTVATLERRFADAVPRAAAAMDAAVDAVANEEGLVRAVSIALGELAASEQELEGMLRMYENNGTLKANGPVKAAVEVAIEAVIAACTIRDQLSHPADPAAEVALHGGVSIPNEDGTEAGIGTHIVVVMPRMPDPAALEAMIIAIQKTTPAVNHARQVVMQQLRGKDVVVRTMVSERRKAEVLLVRTSQELSNCKGVVEERILAATGDAKTMLAAQARRNAAIEGVDRAMHAVNEAMSAMNAFDQQPVPSASDLVTLSSAVSDAKVLADFAYELVGDVTDSASAEQHASSRGVRVLQRSRALVADAAGKVKDGKLVVTKLERHTAFNIAQAECEMTLTAAAEMVAAADQVYHVAKKRFQQSAALSNQQATRDNLDELEYVLIDAARAGVIAAITGRVVGAVKSHFNSVVIEAGGAPPGMAPQ